MLRQVFLYYKNEIIFRHFFAQAYNNETLDLVLTKNLVSYIKQPSEGQLFSKPLLEFQAHYGVFSGVFFLFVSDMADRPKMITAEIQRAAKLFQKNFSNPLDIKVDSPEKQEFTTFIQETHYYLHPKLALMGPVGVGKTTITNFLKETEEPEKKVMNFAEYYRIKIGDLHFDLWDFIVQDDFSPLWNNYIRGTDIIFFVVDGSSLIDNKIQAFINLKRREGKYSSWVGIITHEDAATCIEPDTLLVKYQFTDIKFFTVDLSAVDAKSRLINIFTEGIGLKKPLPPEFRTKLVKANEFVAKEDFDPAIALLDELTAICKEYNEFSYQVVFEKKIAELKGKNVAKKQREEQDRQKIKAPEKIQFKSFTGPKSMVPGAAPIPIGTKVGGLPPIKSLPTPSPLPAQPAASKSTIQPNLPSIQKPAQEATPPPSKSSEDTTGLDTSITSEIQAANPFFSGLTAMPNFSETKKMPAIMANEDESGSATDTSKDLLPPVGPISFQVHPEMQKTRQIELPTVDPINNRMAENVMEKSLSLMREGVTSDKKLNFERSPLVNQAAPQIQTDIIKTKPISAPTLNNPLEAFTIAGTKIKVSPEAEKLGEYIRDLGESLARDMCQKFCEQLQVRMKKTNLNDDDLKKAAELYVTQRRKKA